MKNLKKVLTIPSDSKDEFLNLSYEVEECVRRSLVSNGFCVIYSQHTTSAVFLDYDDEALYSDWANLLEHAVPKDTKYTVDYTPAAAAHLKQLLLGASVTIPISEGHLDLGPRQYIMYGNFDRCREKTVIVKIIGE